MTAISRISRARLRTPRPCLKLTSGPRLPARRADRSAPPGSYAVESLVVESSDQATGFGLIPGRSYGTPYAERSGTRLLGSIMGMNTLAKG
jgi:hypothetical protein